MLRQTSKFHVGQLVVHRRVGYRGVVVDVDPEFRENDAWLEPVSGHGVRHHPWYRVLPDGTAHEAYVAERRLRADHQAHRIRHPLVWLYFSDFQNGVYVSAKPSN